MSEVITNLDDIKRLAAQRRDEFEVMRYSLELMDEYTDAQIDALVDEIAQPIIDTIDCKQCGNCCRALDVGLTPADVDRLSNGIHVPVESIFTRYVDHERGQEMDEWAVIRGRPCPFLDGNLCSVYEHRPNSCRTYPLFTPDFRWTMEYTVAGAAHCPIIYNVLSAMVAKVDEMQAPHDSDESACATGG
jgi:uncharacterized protein